MIWNENFATMLGGAIGVIAAASPAVLALFKINELHVIINSRLSELLEVSKKMALAQGQIEGRDAVRAEMAAQFEARNAGNTSRPALPPDQTP